MAAPRRRSAVVGVGVIALATASLTACSSGSDYSGVCVDTKTSTRVKDGDCRDTTGSGGGGAHGWYYYKAGTKAPAVGERVSGGSFSLPSGVSASKGGVSAKGGSVSRGGFGSGHGSFGG
jgi:hypothetical protein